jgi:aminoglycoside phosphotransferase family enzyme/predicted kinase
LLYLTGMPDSALPAFIRALLGPEAYPHPVERVELLQTHISYVLLAGEHVYKIKKPVDFGFLDFSTLGKRRYYCRREIELNSRMCDETYLGLSRVRRRGRRVTMDGEGEIIEYAVHMRRLPAERMMDRLLKEGKVTSGMVRTLADKLANFHARAETSRRIAEYGDWAIRYNWRENETQWRPYIGRTISEEQDRILRAYGQAFLARKAELLRRRVRERRIRRVHADLRSDAVCFQDGICVFDCVEFSDRLSMLDVTRDVGFLSMDLDYRGRGDLGRAFVRRYVKASGDRDLPALLDFYAAYSACVRGKVEAFLLDQPEVPRTEQRRAARASQRYFRLACRYAESLPPPLLVITCGLAATGKSSLARAVAKRTGAEVISSDVVRKRLARLTPRQRRFERFEGGIYSREFSRRTYDALLAEARRQLRRGRSVILDASFLRRDDRRAAARLAAEEGAQFACVLLEASEDVVRRRIERRLRQGSDPSDARWEIYTGQKRRFQRPSEVAAERLISLDAGASPWRGASAVLKRLRALSPLSLRRR